MLMPLQSQVLPAFQLAVRVVGCAHVEEVIGLAKKIRKGRRIQARLLVKGRHPKLPPVAAVRCTYSSQIYEARLPGQVELAADAVARLCQASPNSPKILQDV
jgi:hypothetical protein